MENIGNFYSWRNRCKEGYELCSEVGIWCFDTTCSTLALKRFQYINVLGSLLAASITQSALTIYRQLDDRFPLRFCKDKSVKKWQLRFDVAKAAVLRCKTAAFGW